MRFLAFRALLALPISLIPSIVHAEEAPPSEAAAPAESAPSAALTGTLTGELGFQSGVAARIAYLPIPRWAIGASFAYSLPTLKNDNIATGVPASTCATDASSHDYRFLLEARPRLVQRGIFDLWLPMELGGFDRHTRATARCLGSDATAVATTNHGAWLAGLGLVAAARITPYLSIDFELRLRIASFFGSGVSEGTGAFAGILPLHTAALGVTGYLPL